MRNKDHHLFQLKVDPLCAVTMIGSEHSKIR